jgi:hypothetical protein
MDDFYEEDEPVEEVVAAFDRGEKGRLMDEQEPEKEPSTPTDGNAQDILCCFMVIVPKEGGSVVVIDPNQRFNAARLATPADIYPALSNALADWQAMKNAEAVLSFQQPFAQQLVQQQQAEALRARLFPGQAPGMGGFPPHR